MSGYQSIAYNSFILMVSFLGLAANASDPQKTYHEEKGCRLTGPALSRSQNRLQVIIIFGGLVGQTRPDSCLFLNISATIMKRPQILRVKGFRAMVDGAVSVI